MQTPPTPGARIAEARRVLRRTPVQDLRDILVDKIGENRGKGSGERPAAHWVVRLSSAQVAGLLGSQTDFVLLKPVGKGSRFPHEAGDSPWPTRGSGNPHRREERQLRRRAGPSVHFPRICMNQDSGE
jgi:hypothetical protein